MRIFSNSPCLTFPKKNARILWCLDKEEKIIDLAVFRIVHQSDFPNYNGFLHKQECQIEALEHYYKKFKIYTGGQVYSDWEDWSLADVLLMIFKYVVKEKEVLEMIFVELGKIDEFAIQLANFNNNYWNLDHLK